MLRRDEAAPSISIPFYSPRNVTLFPAIQIAPVDISDPAFSCRLDLRYVPTLRTFLLYKCIFFIWRVGCLGPDLTCQQTRSGFPPRLSPAICGEFPPRFFPAKNRKSWGEISANRGGKSPRGEIYWVNDKLLSQLLSARYYDNDGNCYSFPPRCLDDVLDPLRLPPPCQTRR